MRSILVVCFGVMALTGCRTPKPNAGGAMIDPAEAGNKPGPSSSALGPGDLLEVRVFQEPELSGIFRVSSEGTIDFPLCGRVSVGGKTSSETADIFTACLQKGFLKHPSVSVLIREYNSKKVFIFGEVAKPGTFPYEENMNIVQVVTLAGGFTKTAAKNNVSVTRVIDNQERKIKVPVQDIGVGSEKNFLLQPGDIIFVPESLF
jgi:protein involved in polysaccharide export with SLBB domain